VYLWIGIYYVFRS